MMMNDLRDSLAQARAKPITFEQLCETWQATQIRALCARPQHLESGHNLPGLVRSAWGRELYETASAEARNGGPCPWRPACSYEVFFNELGRYRGDLAKPYVFAVDLDGEHLLVSLTLFGAACAWAGTAADSLVRALRGGLAGSGASLITPEPQDCLVHEACGLVKFRARSPLRLTFITPYLPGSRTVGSTAANNKVADKENAPEAHESVALRLLDDLWGRLSSLAIWQGGHLPREMPADLWAAASRLNIAAARRPKRQKVSRKSRAQQGHRIKVVGHLGDYQIQGDLDALAPLLALGEMSHIGRKIAMSGFGRFRLHWDTDRIRNRPKRD